MHSPTVINTPDGIAMARLLVVRGMLNLEKKGLRHSSGAIRPRIAKEFGLSPRAKHDAFIEAINATLNQYQGDRS